jgi:hypothetical protein
MTRKRRREGNGSLRMQNKRSKLMMATVRVARSKSLAMKPQKVP